MSIVSTSLLSEKLSLPFGEIIYFTEEVYVILSQNDVFKRSIFREFSSIGMGSIYSHFYFKSTDENIGLEFCDLCYLGMLLLNRRPDELFPDVDHEAVLRSVTHVDYSLIGIIENGENYKQFCDNLIANFYWKINFSQHSDFTTCYFCKHFIQYFENLTTEQCNNWKKLVYDKAVQRLESKE